MFQKKSILLLITASIILFYLPGCGSSKVPESKGGYTHSGIYFGKNFSHYFKRGIEDGCTTAKGDYKKSHTLFNNSRDYNDGWFLGRNRCKHLLVVDEN
jgi:hypothetical protein